jgi:HlyD family secretion protein
VELRTAEREVLSAQSAVVRAQAELDRVSRPDPVALAAADRDVQRAEVSLRAAKATKPTKETKVAQQAAVISAELSIRDAKARRDQLRAGPPPAEVEVARHNVVAARAAFDDARLRLETIRQGPSQLIVDGANVAVGVARSDLEEAEARLQTLTAGPSPDEIASADDAVATARTGTESAQARYAALAAGPPPDQVAQASAAVTAARSGLAVATQRMEELRSHPTEDELRDTQARVEAATAAVSRAQAEAAAPPSTADDVTAYDRRLLTRTVEQEQTQVDALQQQLAATRLEAPFDGVVAQLKATVGGPADPSSPAVVLAAHGESIVGAEISDTDGPRVATGQTASVAVGEGSPLSAEVESVAAGSNPNTRFVRFRVNWNEAAPAVGTTARATVITDQRTDVLLIPQRAVRSSGQRRFVEVVDGNAIKTANVTEGISANGEVEILNGLAEGQLVVVGS